MGKPLTSWYWTYFPAALPNQSHVAWGGRVRVGSFESFVHQVEAENSGPCYAKGRGPHWTAAVLADGHRCKASCRVLTLLAFDSDIGSDWSKLKGWLDARGISYCLYETSSASQRQPKWRAVIPLKYAVDLRTADKYEDWSNSYTVMREHFEGVCGHPLDAALKTACQAIYFGNRRTPDTPVRQVESKTDGIPLDHVSLLATLTQGTGRMAMRREKKPGAPSTKHRITTGVAGAITESAGPLAVRQEGARVWLDMNPPPERGGGLHSWVIQAALALTRGFCLSLDDAEHLMPVLADARPSEVRGALEWALLHGEGYGYLMPGVSLIIRDEDGDIDISDIFDDTDNQIDGNVKQWTVKDLDRELPDIIERAMDDASTRTEDGRFSLVCVQTPTASGKTRAGLEKIVERHGWVWATPTHRLGDEALGRLADEGQSAREMKGLLSWEGPEACKYPDLVRWAAERGWPARKHVCTECPNGGKCVAYRGEKGKGQCLAPHALVPWIQDMPSGVVYDELPPLLDQWHICVRDLIMPILHPSLETDAWAGRRGQAAGDLQRLALHLEAEDVHFNQPRVWFGDALREVLKDLDIKSPALNGDVPVPTPESLHTCDIRDLRAFPHVRTDEALNGILTARAGWAFHRGQVLWAGVPKRPEVPVVVLDATVPVDEVRKAWPDHEVSHVAVNVRSDPAGHSARYVVAKRMSRTRLVKAPTEWWNNACRLFADALDLDGRKALRVGLITHKPAADLIRQGCSELNEVLNKAKQDGTVADFGIMHFGNCRGYNTFKDVDLLISIGDPVPNLGLVEFEAAVLGVSPDTHGKATVEAELAQAHGRARALRRDSGHRVTLVHFGHARPTGPGWDTEIEVRGDVATGMSVQQALRFALEVVGVVVGGDQGYLTDSRVPHENLNENSNIRSSVIEEHSLNYHSPDIAVIIEELVQAKLHEASACLGTVNLRRWPELMSSLGLPYKTLEWRHKAPRPRKVYCLDPERAQKVIAALSTGPVPQVELPQPPVSPEPVGMVLGSFEDLKRLFHPVATFMPRPGRVDRKSRKPTKDSDEKKEMSDPAEEALANISIDDL